MAKLLSERAGRRSVARRREKGVDVESEGAWSTEVPSMVGGQTSADFPHCHAPAGRHPPSPSLRALQNRGALKGAHRLLHLPTRGGRRSQQQRGSPAPSSTTSPITSCSPPRSCVVQRKKPQSSRLQSSQHSKRWSRTPRPTNTSEYLAGGSSSRTGPHSGSLTTATSSRQVSLCSSQGSRRNSPDQRHWVQTSQS